MNRKTAIPFARHIPVLSTAHMPDAYALANLMCTKYLCDLHHEEGGGFLEVPPIEECATWLKPIAKWAKANVFDWIMFDESGDVVDGLEVYDWEAGDGRALAFNAVLNMPLSESFKLPAGAIIFASDLTPPDIKAQRDTYEVFDIPRLPPPTQEEIDAFDAASNKPAVACNESISHGTHRTQDLIPAFGKALEQLCLRALCLEFMALPHGMYQLAVEEGDSAAWWDSEDASELLQDLMDALNAHSPMGFYFGAHNGDGSDFGYWPHEED